VGRAFLVVAAAAGIVLIVFKNTAGFVALNVLVALPIVLLLLAVRRAWRARDDAPGAAGGVPIWAERLLAYLIDLTLPFAAGVCIDVFVSYAVDRFANPLPDLGIAIVVGLWVADFVVLQTLTGRTLGKQVLGLRTVRRGGGRPPLWSVVVRTVPVFPLLGPLGAMIELPFLVKWRDRLGDRLGHTQVVR
jgi:uncharacterized RDD family membrane protein YckC